MKILKLESKQVGQLSYMVSDIQTLISILTYERINSSRAKERNYQSGKLERSVSTSRVIDSQPKRNPNRWKYGVILDGDALSNKYRINPYSYAGTAFQRGVNLAVKYVAKYESDVYYLQLVKWPKMAISKQLYQAIVDIMESQSDEFKEKKGYVHLGIGRIYAGKRRLEMYSYKSPHGGIRLSSKMLPNSYKEIAHNLYTDEFEERIWVGDADHISISNCVIGVLIPKSDYEELYTDEMQELEDALIKCSGDCKILTY